MEVAEKVDIETTEGRIGQIRRMKLKFSLRKLQIIVSPPRMREPPSVDAIDYVASRITPAYAGTTIINSVSKIWSEDHPRVCGNHPYAY